MTVFLSLRIFFSSCENFPVAPDHGDVVGVCDECALISISTVLLNNLMDSPEEIRIELQKFRKLLDDFKMPLEASTAEPLREKLEGKLPEEQIKLCHNQMYTLASLYFAYLKINGVNTSGHPIMQDLARIQKSMGEFKRLQEKLRNDEQEKKQDTETTKEFLQRTLGTTGGAAVTENMKSPAISSATFQGKHTVFKEDDEKVTEKRKTASTVAGGETDKAEKETTKGRKRKLKGSAPSTKRQSKR